jgi:hypothetical protein
MKKLSFALSALGVMAGWVATAGTSLMNGSFESGNFRGWTLDNPRWLPVFPSRHHAGGTTEVVSAWGQQVGLSPVRSAMDGSCFAALGSLEDGHFVGNRSDDITLKQTVALAAGATISGWSFFYNGDYNSQDCAWVKIFDASGQEVANPWCERSGGPREGDHCSTPYLSATPWTQWQWETPADGLYTVTLGMSARGDDNCVSYGFFDDICVQAASPPVPEPTGLTLCAIGALLMAVRRLRRQ